MDRDFFFRDARTVQGIIGRNVSLSWTFNNTNNDAIRILHDSSILLRVWPLKSPPFLQQNDERLLVHIQKTTHDSVTVVISISNVRNSDAGIYKLERQWNSGKFDDSVSLQIFDEAALPKITTFQHILNTSIMLQCNSSRDSAEKLLWKVNGSLIEMHSRYSQNKTFLSIRNLTTDDIYNIYTCEEFGSGFESDPYKLNVSGPSVINFSPNELLAKEHERMNISCLTDCYPFCTWNWTKLDPSSPQRKTVSEEKELQLRNVTRDDAGKYSCRVYNIITRTSHEGFANLDVVYGPDTIFVNVSGDTIELDEFDIIALFCSADCFPPCRIRWTETNGNTMIPGSNGSELQLANVKNNVSYICHATNARNFNATISGAIFIKVRTETIYYMTTEIVPGKPIEGAKHFTTSTLMQGNDAENSDSPPTRNLLFVLLGMGIVLAVGFIACLLRKYRACPCVNRTYNSSSFTHFDEAGGNESRQEENLPGKYWTIVSNAKGEMSTAIETDHDRHVLPTPTSEQEVLKHTKLEQSIRANDTSVVLELDEYMDPVNSSYEKHDDYIHPVNSSHEEHDDYIHPVNSSAEEHIDYIHPVHSDLVNIDVVPKCHTTYF